MEIPVYVCHKEVKAIKIKDIMVDDSSSAVALVIPEGEYPIFHVQNSYVEKHAPQPGGYYVVYDDGYESYSPAKAFEEGYTLKGTS